MAALLDAGASPGASREAPGGRILDFPDRILELSPAAIYVCDADGLIVRYNRRAAALWGRSPRIGNAAERFCGSHRMHRLDGGPLPHAECPMADVLRTGIPVGGQEVVVERPDGSRIVALVNIDPIRDEAGTVAGAINCFNDITDRKRVEEELPASRRDLEDFFENSAVAMHWVGADGTILRANQAEFDLLGYAREEYIGRHIAEFHADRAAIDDILARLSRGEKLDKYAARLRAKDGSVRHVLINSNVQFRGGEFVHTRCITLDVTAERAAEAALRESERRSRALLEALPAAVYTTDAGGRITYYNRAAVELAGREPTLGSDEWCVTWKLYRPDGTPLPHDECPMAVSLKENRSVRGEEAIAERPDGTRVPFMPYPTPLRDETGVLIGAVNMLVDLTESKRAEAALRQSEARFGAIVDQATAGIAETDLTGRFVLVNERYCEMVGYSRAELAGMRMQDITHPDDLPRNVELFQSLVRNGTAFVIEKRYVRKDGAVVWVSNSVSCIRDASGEVANVVAVSVDITERKRAEEQQALLLGEMRHRIKNLFAVASGVVAMSARSARTPQDMAASVRDRLAALTRAQELTRPGLINGGEGAGGRDTTLHALVGAMFAPYADPERGNGRDRVILDGPDVPVHGSAVTSLALVLHEFATNSAKYGALSLPDGVVRFESAADGDALLLTWREEGGPALDGEPDGEGFGSLLAQRTVAGQFGGRLLRDWRPEGLVIRMSVPLAALAGDAA